MKIQSYIARPPVNGHNPSGVQQYVSRTIKILLSMTCMLSMVCFKILPQRERKVVGKGTNLPYKISSSIRFIILWEVKLNPPRPLNVDQTSRLPSKGQSSEGEGNFTVEKPIKHSLKHKIKVSLQNRGDKLILLPGDPRKVFINDKKKQTITDFTYLKLEVLSNVIFSL